MQNFLLLSDEHGGLDILDQITVDNIDSAKNYFFGHKSWATGEVISESDFIALAQSESQLNALENQSSEC
jgi:hypothetical protein